MTDSDKILETLTLVKDISIPPCIWGQRYTMNHGEIEITVDATITYVNNQVVKQLTIDPIEFDWLREELDNMELIKKPSHVNIAACILHQLSFLYELQKLDNDKELE